MSHYIGVTTQEDGKLDSYLNISGDISDFYAALDASEFNCGICGDGVKEVSRETILNMLKGYGEPSPFSEFLADIIDESESEEFTFHFS